MSDYEVIDYYNADGESIIALEIQTGQFAGTIFSFGEVNFPDPNEPILQFDHTIHEQQGDTASNTFKNYIGDILVEIIEKSLESRDVVYKGGI